MKAKLQAWLHKRRLKRAKNLIDKHGDELAGYVIDGHEKELRKALKLRDLHLHRNPERRINP